MTTPLGLSAGVKITVRVTVRESLTVGTTFLTCVRHLKVVIVLLLAIEIHLVWFWLQRLVRLGLTFGQLSLVDTEQIGVTRLHLLR